MNYLSLIKSKIDTNTDLPKIGIHTFLNPYSYLQLRKHPELLKEMDSIFIDGEWLCKFLRWFKVANPKRKSFDMTSIAPMVFDDAEKSRLKIAIIGSNSLEIESAKSNLKSKWSKLELVYTRNGYFYSEQEKIDVIEQINEKNPNLVIVGMGAVLQEEFLVMLKKSKWRGLGYTCGGFFHQTSTTLQYYPKIFDQLNIRWVYRLMKEPKLIKRYFLMYPIFVCIFLNDLVKNYNE